MQIIFRPRRSLNPRMRIANIAANPSSSTASPVPRDELRHKSNTLLLRCGMPPSAADRYPTSSPAASAPPQRIGIAALLALQPNSWSADEPTSPSTFQYRLK